jgi:hypothetical protein
LGHRSIPIEEVHLVAYLAESKTFSDQILRDIPSLQKSERETLKTYYDPAQRSINSLIGTIIYCHKNHNDCMEEIKPIYEDFKKQYSKLHSIRNMPSVTESVGGGKPEIPSRSLSSSQSIDLLKDMEKIINRPYEESAKELRQYEWKLFPNLSTSDSPSLTPAPQGVPRVSQ